MEQHTPPTRKQKFSEEIVDLELEDDSFLLTHTLPVGSTNLGLGMGTRVKINVMPVEAQTALPLNPQFYDLLYLEIAETAKKPLFTGRQGDWFDFGADWEVFGGKVSAGRGDVDELKLQNFEICLDETSRQ